MEGWHVEPRVELGGSEVMRGVGGGSKARRGQAGGMAVGPPCVLVPLVPPGPFFADSICTLLYMQNTPCREGVYTWG